MFFLNRFFLMFFVLIFYFLFPQLLKNATDVHNTLLPLRSWLVSHTDVDSFTLTPRDMNGLLREFSVVYRPEDLEALIADLSQGAPDR